MTTFGDDPTTAAPPDLSALRALAEAATPGPWTTEEHDFGSGLCALIRCPGERDGQPLYVGAVRTTRSTHPRDVDPQDEANAAFIAANDPQSVIALLDLIAEQRTVLERARACVGGCNLVSHGDGTHTTLSDIDAVLAVNQGEANE